MKANKDRFPHGWLARLIAFGLMAVTILATLLAGRAVPKGNGALAAGQDPARTAFLPLLAHRMVLRERIRLPLVVHDYLPPQSVFGVHMAPVSDAGGLQQALAARVRWIRNAAILWDQVEPIRTEPPTYEWSEVEEADLIRAAQSGFSLIGLVRSTPEWAQATPPYFCGPIREDRLDEFGEFLYALVSRYSRAPYYVRYWELWNEPDVDPFDPAFGQPMDPRSPYGCWGDNDQEDFGGGYYAQMLQTAYAAIKAADPRAKVLLGGLLLDCDPANPPPDKSCHSSSFLEGILAAGGGPHFDLVSFHAYTYYWGPGSMYNPNWPGSNTAIRMKTQFLRSVLAEYGLEGKPLINTEAALLCFDADDEECRDMQGAYVPRAYAEAMYLGLAGQLYYRMINETWYATGLLLPDLSPKPAYHAFATAGAFLAGLEYQHPAQGYPAGIEGYTFAPPVGAPHTDVLWSVDGSAVTVTLPPGASAYDRYGQLLASGGTLPVDYRPIYVRRP